MSWIVAPTQAGPPLLAVVAGSVLTSAWVHEGGAEVQPFTVTVTQ